MKHITITGHLGSDPKESVEETTFFVAVNEWKPHPQTGVPTRYPTWFEIHAAGLTRTIVQKLELKKGDLVEIYGDPFPASAVPPTDKIPTWRSRIGINIERIEKWGKLDTHEQISPDTPPRRFLRWEEPDPLPPLTEE